MLWKAAIFAVVWIGLILGAMLYAQPASSQVAQVCHGFTIEQVIEGAVEDNPKTVITVYTEKDADKFIGALVAEFGPPPINYQPDTVITSAVPGSETIQFGFAALNCFRSAWEMTVGQLKTVLERAFGLPKIDL